LAEVILHGLLATTVPLYNIYTLSNRNKNQNIISQFFGKFKEPYAKVSRADYGTAAIWPSL